MLEASDNALRGLGMQPDTGELTVVDGIAVTAKLPVVEFPVTEPLAEMPVSETDPLLVIDALPKTPLPKAEPVPVIVTLPDGALPDNEPLAVLDPFP